MVAQISLQFVSLEQLELGRVLWQGFIVGIQTERCEKRCWNEVEERVYLHLQIYKSINNSKVNKMSKFGFESERLPNLKGQIFECKICYCVVRAPKQCLGCGDMFCTICIDDWFAKKKQCPKRCKAEIVAISAPSLVKLYNSLDIICSKGCGSLLKMANLQQHQKKCTGQKCWNYEYCKGVGKEGLDACSSRCVYLRKILFQSGNNAKKIYEMVKEYQKVHRGEAGSCNKIGRANSYGLKQLKWMNDPCASNIVFAKQYTHVTLKESPYVFRTVVCGQGFTSGQHYWEILADSITENQLKIGVTTNIKFDLNTAFCDYPYGFAYYGLGQLRANSNSAGVQYGKRFKKEGTLGVFIDMNVGTLSFSLDGQSFGIAFNVEQLKKGPIYPAVSLLHCAACTIKGQLPIPQWFRK